MFILSPWPINRKLQMSNVVFVKRLSMRLPFSGATLAATLLLSLHLLLPRQGKGAMTQQFYYLNGKKIHIYALRFEACLTLIDINDDDDAESGCCHAHSSTLPSSSSSCSSSADKSKTSNTSLCISQKGFGCTPKDSRLVNPVNSSLRRLQLLPLTAASFVNLAMEPPSP